MIQAICCFCQPLHILPGLHALPGCTTQSSSTHYIVHTLDWCTYQFCQEISSPLFSLTEEAISSLSLSSTIKLHKFYFTNALQTDAAHVLFIMNKKWANCVNYNILDVGITKDDWRSIWRSKKWCSPRCRSRQDRSSVSGQIPEDHAPPGLHSV